MAKRKWMLRLIEINNHSFKAEVLEKFAKKKGLKRESGKSDKTKTSKLGTL